MYTIIFVAVWLAAGYLENRRKVFASRVVMVLLLAIGFILSYWSIKDSRWFGVFGEFDAAVVIALLVGLYQKLSRLEVRSEHQLNN